LRQFVCDRAATWKGRPACGAISARFCNPVAMTGHELPYCFPARRRVRESVWRTPGDRRSDAGFALQVRSNRKQRPINALLRLDQCRKALGKCRGCGASARPRQAGNSAKGRAWWFGAPVNKGFGMPEAAMDDRAFVVWSSGAKPIFRSPFRFQACPQPRFARYPRRVGLAEFHSFLDPLVCRDLDRCPRLGTGGLPATACRLRAGVNGAAPPRAPLARALSCWVRISAGIAGRHACMSAFR
jgi:hypothetical protein